MKTFNNIVDSFLSERFSDIEANEDMVFDIRKVDQYTNEGDPDQYEPDVTYQTYEILYNDKVVGELNTEDYFNYIKGHLFNKDLPDISNWRQYYALDSSEDAELDEIENDALNDALHRFLNSKTGKKWLNNIDKYKNLDAPTNDYRIKK